MRSLLAALLLLAAAGCAEKPPGTCSADPECSNGAVCTNGVCVGCASTADCRGWQTCDVAARACLNDAGRCTTSSNCPDWQVCDGSHTCVLGPGSCFDATDCAAWEECGGTHRCAPRRGRCNGLADCTGWWPSCDTTAHVCKDVPPGGDDVLLWGTLSEGVSIYGPWAYDVVAPIMDPTRVKYGFAGWASSDWAYRTAYREPNGWLAYADRTITPTRVKSMSPDPWGGGAMLGGYPTTGSVFDPVYPASACASDVDVERFVLREGTGEILYACGTIGVPTAWFDVDGVATVPGTEVKAWNAAGAKLGYDHGTSTWVVFGVDGVARPVTPAPAGSVIDHRANGDGFWLAIQAGSTALWRVDGLGAATFRATYAAPPSGALNGIGGGGATVALDTGGALYSMDQKEPFPGIYQDLVVRYPADGTASSVAYDEGDQAEFNSPSGPPWIYFSPLVRGP